MNDITQTPPYPSQDATNMTHETAITAPRRLDVATLAMLRRFIGPMQMTVIQIGMQGEERSYFIDTVIALGERIAAMPKTYETEGQGLQAVAHLHYFYGGFDWYITEKDAGDPNDTDPGAQHQAHGLARCGDQEMGYISIVELIRNRVEIDLHFKPVTLAALLEKHA